MTNRRRARETAFQFLYLLDLLNETASEVSFPTPHGELGEKLMKHFEHFSVPEKIRSFSYQLVTGTIENYAHLNQVLSESALNWKVERMPLVDRNLLRLATYELLYLPETPASVVIDEALELAKQFGTSESTAFINGILDKISKNSASLTKTSAST